MPLPPAPVFRGETGGLKWFDETSDSDNEEKTDMEETEGLFTGFFTPPESTARHEDERDEQQRTSTMSEALIPHLTSSWWQGINPTAALFTPIPPPDAKFEPLPQAGLPNSYHKYAIRASGERPVSFDVVIHAAYRVAEAAIHAVNAAEHVAVWAKTREPPYTPIPDLLVQELLGAIPAMDNTVRVARRALLYAVKPVANLRPLWNPRVSSHSSKKTKPTGEEAEMAEAWWSMSDETQHMHDAADATVRALHELTKSGRASWRKETRKIVENLDSVRGDVTVAKKTWSGIVSGEADIDLIASSLLAKNAVQSSAEAIQQLVFLANTTASAVSSNRFWQWSTWMKSKEAISPAHAAAYLLAKMEAKEALGKAKAAITQAMAATKATSDYK